MIFSEYQNLSFYGPHYDSFEGFKASFPVHCKWMENFKMSLFSVEERKSHLAYFIAFFDYSHWKSQWSGDQYNQCSFCYTPILIIINIVCVFASCMTFLFSSLLFFLLLHLSSSSSSVTSLVPSPLLSFCFLQQCSSIVVSHSAAALADGHVIKNCLTTLRQPGSRAATHGFTLLLHRKRTHISASQSARTPIRV